MNMLSVTVTQSHAGAKVQDVLRDVFCVSESYLRQLKRRPGALLLNGEPAYTVRDVQAGDVIAFDPSDREKLPIRPIVHELSVVFEDEWLTVLNKASGMSVHPARDPFEPTVENALSARYAGTDNPHPVSRLDKGTTGLLTVAKSGYVHARMKEIQHAGGFQKTYLAIVEGVLKEPKCLIDAPIGPFPGSTYRRCVRGDGAEAKSVCERIASKEGLSLVRLSPLTGRTHQLRVHMAYAGYPLLGDWLYGNRSERFARPLLHASNLSFLHPITGEKISLAAPMPDDMASIFAGY